MTNPLAFIVEDDPKLSDIFAVSLRSANFDTEIVADGPAALVRLGEIVPAIIILDLHLPGLSGEKILAWVRADARFAQTHILLATADAQSAEVLKDQADLILLKPISPLQLRDLAARFREPITFSD